MDALVDCGGCTSCCQFCNVPPFQSIEELMEQTDLPNNIRDPIIRYWATLNAVPSPGPCVWLQGGFCVHWEQRPRICRDFEIGGEMCRLYQQMTQEVNDG